MGQFLEIERDVLEAYLSVRPLSDPGAAPFDVSAPPAPVSWPADESAASCARDGAVIADAPPVDESPVTSAAADAEPALAPAHATEPAADPAPPTQGRRPIRGILRVCPRPRNGPRAMLADAHAIVITDDGRGLSGHLAERLRREGRRVAIVTAAGTPDPRQDRYVSSLESAADVEHLVRLISSACGPIAALVHLLPLSPTQALDDLTVAAWSRRLARETRSLFLLAKALRIPLDGAASCGGSAIIAATRMGGDFGCEGELTSEPVFPGQGGVSGFMKCLALEWPRTRARTVDLDPSEPLDALADYIFQELWTADEEPEVGYRRGTRLGVELVDVAPALDAAFSLPSDSVILATGGARGITADICVELAQRCQPTFVLVGQSPLPESLEPADIRDVTAPAALKRALMNRLRDGGAHVTPAAVDRAYQQVEKERAIRQTLGALVSAGSRVHYVPLDVRDDRAFAALIEGTYEAYGRIDGVIHGAGIIEDKLIQDKTIESFDRVFSTKAISAFVLAQTLRPETLRFAVFFTSVAGRFGNRGQADYAAANEVVNKLAGVLNRRWAARVCAINWGPWDKRGMVSPELRREFARRGVELLATADGQRAFWQEIQQSPSTAAEVVIGGASATIASAPAPTASESMPLLRHATREPGAGAAVQYRRVLDPDIDRFLADHTLDGQSVLPLAIATELMAEAAQATWPDLTVIAVRDLRLLKGITIEERPQPTIVTVRPPANGREDGCTEAHVEIATPSSAPTSRYRAVVELATRMPEAPAVDASVGRLTRFPLPLDEAYRRWTFHGALFQRLTSIEGISAAGIVGRMYSPSDSKAVAGVARAGWIVDPFVFDAALQLLLLWSRAQNDMTALPTRFSAFRRYAALSDTRLTAYVHVESLAAGHALRNDVYFIDDQGRVRAWLEGMEASCTAALNRLAASGGNLASVR
jgi:NAD(P)-dependent dehydrogenase (short-subunit alcohol dehydrogenase family)